MRTRLLRSLLVRFMVVAVPLLLVFVVFNIFFVAQREQNALTDELHKRAVSICRNLALNGAQARESFGDYLLPPLARAAVRLPDVAWVAFTDEKGRVLAEAGSDTSLVHSVGPLQDAVRGLQEAVETVHDGERDFVGVCQPMTTRMGSLGAVQLGVRTDSLRHAVTAARSDALVLTLLLGLAVTLVTLPLIYVIVVPVGSIVHAAREIADGNLDARVPPPRRDELGRLCVALNRMAEQLGDLMERERSKRAALEDGVAALRACSAKVAEGQLDLRAPRGEGELGRLASGFNEMVENVGNLVERERAIRADLEANRSVLEAANQRLVELDRKKSDFLNTVSHELRTPLTSIKAFSEILLEQQGDAAADREFLAIIDQEADRLTRLIEDLLDLSHIEEGQAAQNVVRLPLDVVVDACVRSCRGLAEQKSVIIRLDGERDLAVRGDRDRLAQVVTNLLSNAVKFSPHGGEVVVRSGREDAGVMVTVTDTGVGISPSDQQRIFEKFHQVDHRYGPGAGVVGSGLGLPIVKSIVEAHGGRVAVESTPGKGSTFKVWLPSA